MHSDDLVKIFMLA